ncbi:MAG TPA: tetratricopeptide repeat-containing glycosyltransferase family protein [Acidocella sp.]
MQDLGQLDDAVAACKNALRLKPDFVVAHYNLGNMLKALGCLDDAVASYNNAISCKPDFAEAHCSLGTTLKALGRLDEAITAYDNAILCKPDFAEAHSNLGTALQELGRLDEAVSAYNTAILCKPDFAEAHSNLGNTLKNLGRLDEAIAAYNTAIGCKPDYAQAHFNLGIGLLLAGDFSNGWTEYDWRWRGGVKEQKPKDVSTPEWRGEDLNGRTILLHAEQGLGDTIQFCRYAPLVAASGGRVVLEAPRSLLRLLAGLQGVDRLIATGDPLPAFDFHCKLMSLPNVFGTTLATIPASIPYLPVEAALRQHWQQRLGPVAGRRVGIVWAGNPKHQNDRNRSLPFTALAPLWNIPGIDWYSLQVGERRADLDAALLGTIEDLSPDLDDFAETAAAISQLDLLLTVDTAVAHLAGAIGCPAWVMLPLAPDWRWLTERQDNPWYPSARLFRQAERGAWGGVVHNIAAALAERWNLKK